MSKTPITKTVVVKPEVVPDIIKARAALNAARKAFDIADRKRLRALARLNIAQVTVDKAVAGIKSGAPSGSNWGGVSCVVGVDLAGRADSEFSIAKLISRRG